jgi:hypothetical protein
VIKLYKKLKNFLRKRQNLEFPIKVAYWRWCALIYPLFSDEAWLRGQYKRKTGKQLNLDEPKLFNEKLQWLKLNYHNPLMTRCVDKWEVRSYIEEQGLASLLVPAYGPYDSVKDIPFDELPDKFIIKMTNGSSFNMICDDRATFDLALAEKQFSAWLKLDLFPAKREWAYQHVTNRLMVEHLLQTETGEPPSDTRIFCFHGEPRYIAVDMDSVVDNIKTSNYYRNVYDISWNQLDASLEYPSKPGVTVPKPHNLDTMLDIARQLSAEFPFVRIDLYNNTGRIYFGELTFYHASGVRIDLYNNTGRIYFGELTFYHASGYQNIQPEAFHEQLGDHLDLSHIDNTLTTA